MLKPFVKEFLSLKRAALLIIIFGLLVLCHRAEAGELAMLYSNDTGGMIDPCPT
jgi:hypothetical protein